MKRCHPLRAEPASQGPCLSRREILGLCSQFSVCIEEGGLDVKVLDGRHELPQELDVRTRKGDVRDIAKVLALANVEATTQLTR